MDSEVNKQINSCSVYFNKEEKYVANNPEDVRQTDKGEIIIVEDNKSKVSIFKDYQFAQIIYEQENQ